MGDFKLNLKNFWEGIQKDFRLFIFILILLEIYRAAFIWVMSDYISEDSTSAQISAALWIGLRLSLKTAGFITTISFVFVTIFGLKNRVRVLIGIISSLMFSILFMARFPYYREYNATFGIEVVRGMDESFLSLMSMIVQEYGFIWRFPTALLLTIICTAILSRLLLIKTVALPDFKNFFSKFIFSTALLIFIAVFGVFVRFGGSFTYSSGINWENSAVTSDNFLNECILESQSIYMALLMDSM